MTHNNTTTIIATQPDRPTLGYFANTEAARYRLISDGGMWEKDTVTYPMTCPHDDRTTCRTGQQCETCQIFWDMKEAKQ